MTKENLIKIIGSNFKPKDVGIGVLDCISEKEQVENLANELLKAINYTRCSLQLKDKEVMTFEEWLKNEGYEEKWTGYWKDGKSQTYWTMKDRYNIYRNNL